MTRFLCRRFIERRCTTMAAALAYSTLLSLVPLLIVSATVLSYFPLFKGTGAAVQHFIFDNFVASSASVINQHITDFLGQVKRLSWFNFIALIFVSLLLMYNMVRSFNYIWGVKLRHHLAVSFGIYFFVLLCTPIGFGVVIFASSYLASWTFLMGETMTHLKKSIFILLPHFSVFLMFSFFNWALPSCKVKLKFALLAGFVTTILFEIIKYAFVFYLHHFTTYRIIYGALASIPFFIVWIYLCWSIILLGALLCYGMQNRGSIHAISD